jgi:hypothetical protein
VYDAEGHQVVREVVAPFQRFLSLAPGDVEWISPDPELFLPMLKGTRWEYCRVLRAPRAIAAAVARTAIQRNKAVDPAAIEANYVRRSDAELLFT